MAEVGTRHANSIIPYIAITKAKGKIILFPIIREMEPKLKTEVEIKEHEGIVKFPNGSKVIIFGADNREDIELLRGGKYRLVVLDECQAFKSYLKELLVDAIEPALMDYNGTIIMSGTPNPTCTGFFFEATNGVVQGWTIRRWTALDNPHIPNPAAYLAGLRERYGYTENDPSYRREYFGEWVLDTKKAIFRYSAMVNKADELPEADDWTYVLGIDLGYVDSTAFVVYAFSEALGAVYVVHSYKQDKLIPSAVAAHVSRLMQSYDFERIVADTGGLGKGYAEEMKQRFGLPIEAAQKRDKLATIELLNGDLRSGRLKILSSNRDLIDEIQVLQWNEARTGPDERYDDHLADAMLYGWRACRAYLHEDILNLPLPGTKEWYESEEKRIVAQEEEELTQRLGDTDRPYWETLAPEADFDELSEQLNGDAFGRPPR